MCVFLLAAGLSLLKQDGPRGAQIGPVVLFVYLFTIMYSLGEGPVAFQYSAEVFPNIQREQGMAFVVFINNFFGTSLSLCSTWLKRISLTTSRCAQYHLPSNADSHDADWSL